MENRKELSEKSKKLIAMQFKSDILNTSTGYYKKENIFPITPKPNELKQKIKEFVPQYKEIKPIEMHYNNLLSDQQKHNDLIMKNIKITQIKINPELESKRKRARTIKDNCYDRRGNFSARKRHLLEFYGIEKLEKLNSMENLEFNNTTIKERRKNHNRSLFIQPTKRLNLNNINNDYFTNNSNTDRYNTIEDRDKENYNNNIKEKEYENINDDFFDENIIIQNTNHNKISRNRNDNNIFPYNISINSNEDYQNTINCVNNKDKMYRRIKTDINFPDLYNNNNTRKIEKKEKEKKNYYHPKELSKVFYTQVNKPVKSNRLNKNERDNDEKELFNIEIRNSDSINDNPSADPKKIKEIFHKNGLHAYDFNEDGMNILSREKKMEAKLRKNKKDENFERNYRKTEKELKKYNITINKRGMVSETGFESKVVRKKRKGTPGKVLYKNKEKKDENTKLNTGLGFKKDKNILPQKDNNYKNDYNYKNSYYNHNKK